MAHESSSALHWLIGQKERIAANLSIDGEHLQRRDIPKLGGGRFAVAKTMLVSTLMAAFIVSLSAIDLRAQSSTWTGNGDGTSWADPSNWSNGVPNAAGEIANFDLNSATGEIDLGPSVFGNVVRLDRIDANNLTGDITLTNSIPGGVIELYGESGTGAGNDIVFRPLAFDGTRHTFTIENNLKLFEDILFFNSDIGGDRLHITGDIESGNPDGFTILQLTGRNNEPGHTTNNDATIHISGVISDGASGSLLRVDTGWTGDGSSHQNTVRLTGNNTFTGGVNVWTNTLEFDSVANTGVASALGAGSADTLAADRIDLGDRGFTGTMRYIGSDSAGHATNRGVHLFDSGAGGGRIEANGAGRLTFNSDITAENGTSKTLFLGGTSLGQINGTIEDLTGGSVHVTKEGSGTWTLTGDNLYAGNTRVQAGTLELNGGRIGTDGYEADLLSISAGATFSLDGGRVRVGDFENDGTFDFKAGELQIGSINRETFAGSLVIGTEGPGTLDLAGGTRRFNDLTLHGTDDQLELQGGGDYFFQNLDNSAGGRIAANSSGIDINIAESFTYNVPSGSVEMLGNIAGTGAFTKEGDGTLNYFAIGSYTGDTTVRAGTLKLNLQGNISDESVVHIDDGATVDVSAANGGDQFYGLRGGGDVVTGPGSVAVKPTLARGATLFSGTVTGTGNFIKRGDGRQILAGDNTYTGSTNIEEGKLEVSGSIVATSGVSYVGAELHINGGTLDTPGNLRPTGSRAKLILDGGLLKANQIDRSWNSSYLDTFDWNAGTVHLLSATEIVGGTSKANRPFSGSLSLNASKHLIVDENLTVGGNGQLTIAGGSVTATDIVFASNGVLDFSSGTLRVNSDQELTAARLSALDIDGLLGDGKTLEVNGRATLSTPLTIASGGTLATNRIDNPENLTLTGGQLDVAVALSPGEGTSFDATSGSVINAGSLSNRGSINLIGATGTFGNSDNLHEINAINSELTFEALLNQSGSSLNLINTELNGSLTNQGDISIAGSATFSGDVASAAGFSGEGKATFSKSFSTVDTTADIPFAGDVAFTTTNTLNIGIASSDQFDRLLIEGSAELDGTLEVQLLGGYAPSLGERFQFLTAGSVTGEFDDLVWPTFSGRTFDVLYDEDAVTLSVVSALRLCGDFDQDGDVDSADNTTLISNWTGALPPGEGSLTFEQGDCDGDGDVDSADRTGVTTNWTGATSLAGTGLVILDVDSIGVNTDSNVDSASYVQDRFGYGLASAVVPEPNALPLALLAALAIVFVGRRNS